MKLVVSGTGLDMESYRYSASAFPSENVLSLLSPQNYTIISVPSLALVTAGCCCPIKYMEDEEFSFKDNTENIDFI